jgi:hypothetical protein
MLILRLRTVPLTSSVFDNISLLPGYVQNDSYNCGVFVLVHSYLLSLNDTWSSDFLTLNLNLPVVNIEQARKTFWIIGTLLGATLGVNLINL